MSNSQNFIKIHLYSSLSHLTNLTDPQNIFTSAEVTKESIWEGKQTPKWCCCRPYSVISLKHSNGDRRQNTGKGHQISSHNKLDLSLGPPTTVQNFTNINKLYKFVKLQPLLTSLLTFRQAPLPSLRCGFMCNNCMQLFCLPSTAVCLK